MLQRRAGTHPRSGRVSGEAGVPTRVRLASNNVNELLLLQVGTGHRAQNSLACVTRVYSVPSAVLGTGKRSAEPGRGLR